MSPRALIRYVHRTRGGSGCGLLHRLRLPPVNAGELDGVGRGAAGGELNRQPDAAAVRGPASLEPRGGARR